MYNVNRKQNYHNEDNGLRVKELNITQVIDELDFHLKTTYLTLSWNMTILDTNTVYYSTSITTKCGFKWS